MSNSDKCILGEGQKLRRWKAWREENPGGRVGVVREGGGCKVSGREAGYLDN